MTLETTTLSDLPSKLELLQLRTTIRNSLPYTDTTPEIYPCYVDIEVISFKDALFTLRFTPFVKDQGFLSEQLYEFSATNIPSQDIITTLIQQRYPEYFL